MRDVDRLHAVSAACIVSAMALVGACTLSFETPSRPTSRDARTDAPITPRSDAATDGSINPPTPPTIDGATTPPPPPPPSDAAVPAPDLASMHCDPATCPDDDDPCTTRVCDERGMCAMTAVPDGTSCGSLPTDTQMCCGGACRDLAVDTRHCGSCETSCDSDDAGLCRDGACVGCTSSADCTGSLGMPSCLRRADCMGGRCDILPAPGACFIDRVCWDVGDVNPENACEACRSRSTTWQDAESCDDGTFCTAPDPCVDGMCRSGPARDCDDGNPCTTDVCNEAADRCDHVSTPGVDCDDRDVCTMGETCVVDGAGSVAVCRGTPDPCTTTDLCRVGRCDSAAGCVTDPAPNGDPCILMGCPIDGVCWSGECLCGAD